MHTRLASCRIKASCEYIFLASDVLNNPHLNQSVQPRLHLFIQRSLMIQCINHKKIFRREHFCTCFTDSVNNRKHCLINNQPIQRYTDEKVISARKVRERLCFLNAQLKHQVHTLPRALYHTAKRQYLCNAAITWKLSIQNIVKRDTMRKTAGTFNKQSITKLANKILPPS